MTPCPFRPGRTQQQQDAIIDTIRSCGVDATLAQVNARLASMKLTATEGEFLRIYRTFHPEFGVPQLVNDDGSDETPKGGPDQCIHCKRPCHRHHKRGLCVTCYKQNKIRKKYTAKTEQQKESA